MHALQSADPLIVYFDIKSPYAFVAMEPTLKLQSELGIPIDWRPLTLDIPSYLGSARKEDGKVVASDRTPEQWTRIKYGYKDARRYVERQGYMLKGTEKIWDSSIANIGILWVMKQAPGQMGAYFKTTFPAFWRRELDIEDVGVVETCLQKAGLETSGFRDFLRGDGRRSHDDLQKQLHPSGIYGVPTYVLDGEIFFGREHLPYIRWHLAGRSGAAPDMAYEV